MPDKAYRLKQFIGMVRLLRSMNMFARGESDENLRNQFEWADSNCPDVLADMLFMVGEKGRMCWMMKPLRILRM